MTVIDGVIVELLKLKGNLRFLQSDVDEIVIELEKISKGETDT